MRGGFFELRRQASVGGAAVGQFLLQGGMVGFQTACFFGLGGEMAHLRFEGGAAAVEFADLAVQSVGGAAGGGQFALQLGQAAGVDVGGGQLVFGGVQTASEAV